MNPPTFLERARKAVVAFGAIGVAYAGIVLDVFGNANLETTDGIIAAVFALLTGLGVYQVPNRTE